ncbi:hypothetical protein AHMF7616_01458 [Adhaeribacter pallidiroseus]|uniref:Uncharacterized protein n=1 Tax=Adhaeribacter pallidiroseus TaxID=2072847 RepID=A0A369QDR9_9BACT|nr:hypothetical protein AHMF7616_01458 [Adhaeribacter pallidiroseus]
MASYSLSLKAKPAADYPLFFLSVRKDNTSAFPFPNPLPSFPFSKPQSPCCQTIKSFKALKTSLSTLPLQHTPPVRSNTH